MMRYVLSVVMSLLLFTSVNHAEGFLFNEAAKLPVLHEGRVKPIDTVARSSVLLIQEKQKIRFNNQEITPIEWLFLMATSPQIANQIPIFRIDNPAVKMMLSIDEKTKMLSFEQLTPHLASIFEQADRAVKRKQSERAFFQTGIIELNHKVTVYLGLQHAFFPPSAAPALTQYAHDKAQLVSGLAIFNRFQKGALLAQEEQDQLMTFNDLFKEKQLMGEMAQFWPILLPEGSNEMSWQSYPSAMLRLLDQQGQDPPMLQTYAQLLQAYLDGQGALFNESVANLREETRSYTPTFRLQLEVLFNQVQPLYLGILLYGLGILLLLAGAIGTRDRWVSWANGVFYSALGLHTLALLSRMLIQLRPPVTNLYSSAVFSGWVAIVLCWLMNRIYGRSVGTLPGCIIGVLSLIIAHQLSIGSDSMEVMRAVLDSNFWLSTHVITMTMGIGAAFLAGILGMIYIFKDIFSPQGVAKEEMRRTDKMCYGVVCGALLLSFVGTVLGGIWGDQSWGRFWGWDPKENGALLVVLYNAIILHLRLLGRAKGRSLMVLAVGGNIVASFCWFGVNMLGVGLHSYGFMEESFRWLVLFWVSQIMIMLVGLLPSGYLSRQG